MKEETEDRIEVVPSTASDYARVAQGGQDREEGSSVSEEQWRAIRSLLEYLLNYRMEE